MQRSRPLETIDHAVIKKLMIIFLPVETSDLLRCPLIFLPEGAIKICCQPAIGLELLLLYYLMKSVRLDSGKISHARSFLYAVARAYSCHFYSLLSLLTGFFYLERPLNPGRPSSMYPGIASDACNVDVA